MTVSEVVEQPVATYVLGPELYVAMIPVPAGPKLVPPIVMLTPPAVLSGVGTAVTVGAA
jgi:hypothetical protein